MPSVAKAVLEAIENDLVAQGALERGIVNHHALAMWIKRTHRVEGSLDAIAKAVRRAKVVPSSTWHARALAQLAQVTIRVGGEVGLIVARSSPHAARALAETALGRRVGVDAVLWCVDVGGRPSIVVEAACVDAFLAALGPGRVENVRRGLVLVALEATPERPCSPDALALAVSMLAWRGIRAECVVGTPQQRWIVVDGSQRAEAFGTLDALVIAARRARVSQGHDTDPPEGPS